MTRREGLAREAVSAALRVRARVGLAPDDAACPFDVAEELGVTVAFEPLASLEGMYSPHGPSIVLGSLRPAGRRAFTCGHELGHHVLGHGFNVDELLKEKTTARNDTEYCADRFSAALLMPKLAVLSAFTRREWAAARATAEQLYIIAGCFGVGYSTLVGYLDHTLHEVTPQSAIRLAVERTSKIRARLLGFAPRRGLLVIDEHWRARPAEVEVGDHVLLPPDTQIAGGALVVDRSVGGRLLATAASCGRCVASTPVSAVDIRVSRPGFRGLAIYRYFEDAEDDP